MLYDYGWDSEMTSQRSLSFSRGGNDYLQSTMKAAQYFLLSTAICVSSCQGWVSTHRAPFVGWKAHELSQTCLAADATVGLSSSSSAEGKSEEEWEYVEFESLTEADVVGSEWIIGTNWNDKPNKIDETWVRLLTTEDGKNEAIWGDDSTGTWAIDAASQYFSISKNYLWGKTIWAGVVEDYYYQQGTVRGWNYWSAAAVYGQWQARRLGVDPEEAGAAPWFQEDEDESTQEDE